jgi:D-alanyl-D-alanine carboxypeptidase
MFMKQIAGTLIGLFVFLVSTFSAAAERPEDIHTFVKNLCQEAVDSGKTVGLSVGVARADTIVVAEGFGLANVELKVPATKDTVYRIGSVTKEFTAAAVLLLVEDGLIELDAPISDYVPDYPEHARSVTVRHLLHHTSGVRDFTRLPDYRKERSLEVSQKSDMLTNLRRSDVFYRVSGHRATERLPVRGRFLMYR